MCVSQLYWFIALSLFWSHNIYLSGCSNIEAHVGVSVMCIMYVFAHVCLSYHVHDLFIAAVLSSSRLLARTGKQVLWGRWRE